MSDDQADDLTMVVVCDSPKHARGKVATIAVYHRFPEGWWAGNVAMRPRPRRRRQNKDLDAPTRESLFLAVVNPGERPCKLCGSRLQPEASQDELNYFAARGMSRISIRQLQLLRLGRKR